MDRIEEIGPYRKVIFSPAWSSSAKLASKRIMDVIASSTTMLLLFPLYLVLAIAVKLTSPGRVFYKWQDVANGAGASVGYKFRSIIVDAHQLTRSLHGFDEI